MELQKLGEKYKSDKATFHEYCDFYEEHLPNRNFKGRLLEIGVFEGASLKMWREYYPKAEIVGIDSIDKSHITIPGVEIYMMDATDIESVKTLGEFDIIIDDGSHYTKDQQESFKHLYKNQLKKNGFYIIEDLHTSLMPMYVNSELTTLDYLKKKKIKADHFRRDPNDKDSMTAIIKAGQKI